MDRTSGRPFKRGLFVAFALVVLALLAGGALFLRRPDSSVAPLKDVVLIPSGGAVLGSKEADEYPPYEVSQEAFWMGRYEVTVSEFVKYLTAGSDAGPTTLPQVVLRRGRWRPRWGQRNKPITSVSHRDAQAYCRWLSTELDRVVRLPTEQEWEYAARGGITRARFPWGWGDPLERARYDAESSSCVGRYQPNPYGLYDMAGNVFEWCARNNEESNVPARGGSWAERNPETLRVFSRTFFPDGYRDADVGFRILVERP